VKKSINSHHMSITDGLKEYAETKLSRIENFQPFIESITIDLDMDHPSHDAEQYKASIRVHVPGTVLQASETSDSMYASIDLVMDKMYVQLKRIKEKSQSHRKDVRHLTPESKSDRSISVLKDSGKGIRFIKQPMDPQEAADIMDRENLPLLVFRRLSDETVNVLYRRSEDQNLFDLIEIG
jgi:putative sigma-54 modulation protein